MRRLPFYLLAVLAAAAWGGRIAGGNDSEPARMIRVVDGDTLKVRVDGRAETVRLIGLDTPETHRPGTPVECGARAATRAMRRGAPPGRRVRLVYDATQDRRDRYGRLLAYVETLGGRDLGEAEVRDGWGRVYIHRGRPFARAWRYRTAARAAREAGRGVHAACGGDFHG